MASDLKPFGAIFKRDLAPKYPELVEVTIKATCTKEQATKLTTDALISMGQGNVEYVKDWIYKERAEQA